MESSADELRRDMHKNRQADKPGAAVLLGFDRGGIAMTLGRMGGAWLFANLLGVFRRGDQPLWRLAGLLACSFPVSRCHHWEERASIRSGRSPGWGWRVFG